MIGFETKLILKKDAQLSILFIYHFVIESKTKSLLFSYDPNIATS